MASASICCWPPDSERRGLVLPVGEHREQVEHAGDPAVAVVGVAAVDVGAHLEVLADGHLREHALAAGQEADRRSCTRCSGAT